MADMNKVFSHISELYRVINLIIRVKLAGIFDSRLYKKSNPDIGCIPPLFHWFRYGYNENSRSEGLSITFKWIGPKFSKGEISIAIARRIMRDIKLDKISGYQAKKYKLNYSDYLFMQYIDNRDFERSLKILPECSPKYFLDGAYYFGLKRLNYNFFLQALNSSNKLNSKCLKTNRMLADIAQTIGVSGEYFLMNMITNLNNDESSILSQIFSARLPVIEHEASLINPILNSFNNFNLSFVSDKSRGLAASFYKDTKGYEALINCATYNSLNRENLFCITGNNSTLAQLCSLSSWNGRVVKFRLLMPQYWTEPQTKEKITKKILEIHKELIRYLLGENIALVPVFATPLYDITDEDNYGLSTISYHTISRNSGERYFHYKESFLPGLFSSDCHGYSGWSSLAENFYSKVYEPVIVKKFRNKLVENYVNKNISKYDQTHINNTKKLPPKFIFVALQVPDDTVSRLTYRKTSEWVNDVIFFGESEGIPVVVKIHPKDKSNKKWLYGIGNTKNVYFSNLSIHELIANSMVVITCNSGVGFEALIHHKDVITCGLCDYQSVTYVAKSREDLYFGLKEIMLENHFYTEVEIDNFLYNYCKNSCLEKNLTNPVPLIKFIKSNKI
jgi:hypothetical protein